MDLETAVVIGEFSTRSMADLAAAELRAHGVECVVKADDCGGNFPVLQLSVGVRLLVNPTDRDAARTILQESPPPDSVIETIAEPSPAQQSNRPGNVKLFVVAPMVGFLLGLLVYRVVDVIESSGLQVQYYDANGDGRHDEAVSYDDGRIIWHTFDRNFDGNWDYWYEYRQGQIYEVKGDDNFDGKADAWTYYSGGNAVREEQDTDFNGEPDVAYTLTNGVTIQADWKPNRSDMLTMRQVFQNGVLAEEFRDLDGDGRFDVVVKYDPFQTPLQTNNFLRLLSRPSP